MGAYSTQAIIISQVILIKVGCSGSHPLSPSHFNLQASPRGLERPPSRASSAVKLQASLIKISYFGRHPLMPSHYLHQLSFPYGLIIAHLVLVVKTFFCQVLYFSEKILDENLVTVFPVEWVLDALAYHSCGTDKGFSLGFPSHNSVLD